MRNRHTRDNRWCPNYIAGPRRCPPSTKSAPPLCGARPSAPARFRGSEVDLRDGFIHFSTAEQVAETAAKHFAGAARSLLLRVDAATLGDRLKWEPSRGGALFPHLYGDLDPAAVTQGRCRSPLGPDGHHHFPPLDPCGRAKVLATG